MANALNPNLTDSDNMRQRNGTIPAVRINSIGDRRMFNVPIMLPTYVLAYPFMDYQWPSPLAFMIGLPWVVRLVSGHRLMFERTDPSQVHPDILNNPEARLVAAVYTGGEDGEFLPSERTLDGIQYQALPGTVHMMHLNGAVIDPEHIKAFIDFMEMYVLGYEDLKAFDASVLNRPNFTTFWENHNRHHELNLHSPYDVLPGHALLRDEHYEEWRRAFYHFCSLDSHMEISGENELQYTTTETEFTETEDEDDADA